MRGSSGYAHSEARSVLRRFSSQVIHLLAKWDAAPDPRLGISLPLARDLVFGSLEHIVWTALVQGRVDQIDVPKMSRDLAGAYLRAFGLAEERTAAIEETAQAKAQPRPWTWHTACQQTSSRVRSSLFCRSRCQTRRGHADAKEAAKRQARGKETKWSSCSSSLSVASRKAASTA